MRIGISWNPWESVRKKSPLARFQEVLCSALRTDLYAQGLKEAGLGTFADIRALETIDEACQRLPVTEFEEFTKQSPSGARQPSRTRVGPHLPYLPGPQVVSLDEAQRLTQCQAIAASAEDLLALTRVLQRSGGPVPVVENAIFPSTSLTGGTLTPEDRDRLWRVFRVPAFEQLLGIDGQVIAAECVAHEGLHLVGDHHGVEIVDERVVVTSLVEVRHPILRVATDVSAELRRGICGCGRTEPRLLNTCRISESFTANALIA